jgi:hypothetical protein
VQNAGDVDLADAVNADVRRIVYKVEVDWNRDGLYTHTFSNLTTVVKSIGVNRDINNSLPQETTLVEGFHAAQLTIRLGGTRPGDAQTIAHTVSMWRTDSVLFGQSRTGVPVRVYIGHRFWNGIEVQPQQFQGVITDCRVVSSAREVTLICQDPSDGMRAAIDLPGWAMPEMISKYTGGSLVLKTNSQWVIDHVFRRNEYYMSPPCHAKTSFALTLHGSLAPERGHQAWFWIRDGGLTSEESPYLPGRPGWGLAWGGSSRWWAAVTYRSNFTNFAAAVNQTLVIQCQVNTDYADKVFPGQDGVLLSWSSGATYLSGSSWIVHITSTRRIMVNAYRDTSLVSSVLGPTLGTGWQDMWVEIELGASLATSTYRWVGGTSTSVDLSGLTNPVTVLYNRIVLFAQLPMHDLQISDRTGLATQATIYNAGAWTPEVDIDTGLNDVVGLPLRRGVNSWDLLKEVVAAEFGVLGFTEAGRPFFRNRDTVRRSTLTTVKTIDQVKVLSDFGLTERSGSVRNNVTINYASRFITGPNDAYGVYEVIYALKDPSQFLLPPGATTVDVTIDEPNAIVDTNALTQFTTAQWNDPASVIGIGDLKHGFVTVDTTGAAVTTGITATVLVPLSPQDTKQQDVLRIIFVNNTQSFVQFKTIDGHPALHVRGLKYFEGQTATLSYKRQGSITRYGERVLELPQSDWHQLPTSLQKVAVSLLKDLQTPVPVVDQIEAVGDCRLQLQDTVLVEDRGGLGGPMTCQVTGISRELTDLGDGKVKLTDRLSVRPLAAPGKWILGHPTWSILGQTTRT